MVNKWFRSTAEGVWCHHSVLAYKAGENLQRDVKIIDSYFTRITDALGDTMETVEVVSSFAPCIRSFIQKIIHFV